MPPAQPTSDVPVEATQDLTSHDTGRLPPPAPSLGLPTAESVPDQGKARTAPNREAALRGMLRVRVGAVLPLAAAIWGSILCLG